MTRIISLFLLLSISLVLFSQEGLNLSKNIISQEDLELICDKQLDSLSVELRDNYSLTSRHNHQVIALEKGRREERKEAINNFVVMLREKKNKAAQHINTDSICYCGNEGSYRRPWVKKSSEGDSSFVEFSGHCFIKITKEDITIGIVGYRRVRDKGYIITDEGGNVTEKIEGDVLMIGSGWTDIYLIDEGNNITYDISNGIG